MKSYESDQIELATNIYIDACAKCIAVNPDKRDINTIISRVKNEGLSFLTITLPQFCVDFERSLAEQRIDPTAFLSFKKVGAIPAFLQGMLGQIFDKVTGGMYGQEIIDSIDCPVIVGSIRQICRAFTKLAIDCRPERVHRSIKNFIHTERFLNETSIQDSDIQDFMDVSTRIWGSMFRYFSVSELRPKHGPGATAEGILGNQKYRWQYWYERLEPYFPFVETAYTLSCIDSVEFKSLKLVPKDDELPVRVVTVPKTQKGPRIIAIEPCCMQYAQQSIRSYLYDLLQSHRLTAGHINFSDQTVNRDLAMKASTDGLMATLDLSDASDRVKHDLAIRMFDGNPDLQDAINACRSRYAKMPDGSVIGPLAKFASMGSALCFPIESMYFYTICIVALLREQRLPVSDRNIFNVSRSVYVYGDDIIVPSRLAIAVCDYLQKYNCKVNNRKSFWTGKFRESCGLDAYDGEEVTPTYIRQLHPTNRRQVKQLISFMETAKAFYKKGYWRSSSYMYSICERYLGKLPYVADDFAGLGRVSFRGFRTFQRWNKSLQRFEVKAWTPEPVYRTDKLNGYGALMKSLLAFGSMSNHEIESCDEQHLERSARRGVVALKSRWLAVI